MSRFFDCMKNLVFNQCGRKCGNAAENFRMAQAVDNGAKTAHRESADKSIFPFMRKREGVTGKVYQVFCDKFSVFVARDIRITVKFIVTRRHDNAEVIIVCQCLYPGTVYPVGIVAQYAMQQVQCFKRLFLRNRHSGENDFICRNNNVNRDSTHQRFGKKVNSGKCHEKSLLSD